MSLQAYAIVFHSKINMDEWNKFIKGLRERKIKYEVRKENNIVTLMFWTDMDYYHNDRTKKKIKWAEMRDIIAQKSK